MNSESASSHIDLDMQQQEVTSKSGSHQEILSILQVAPPGFFLYGIILLGLVLQLTSNLSVTI